MVFGDVHVISAIQDKGKDISKGRLVDQAGPGAEITGVSGNELFEGKIPSF